MHLRQPVERQAKEWRELDESNACVKERQKAIACMRQRYEWVFAEVCVKDIKMRIRDIQVCC